MARSNSYVCTLQDFTPMTRDGSQFIRAELLDTNGPTGAWCWRITTACDRYLQGDAGIPRKLQPFKSRRRNRECRHADSQQALPKRVGLSDSLRGDVPEEGVTVAAGVNGPPYAGARRSAHCAYGAGERSRVGHLVVDAAEFPGRAAANDGFTSS